jgi:nitroreductase
MDVFVAIRKRYSCRSYKEKEIEREKLNQLLEAARLAPSAKNLQDWRFVIVTETDEKRKLAQAANNQTFLEKAGIILVACTNSDYLMRCGQPAGVIDVAIALEHICLQATELGLATCWIGAFYPEKVKPIVGIPADITIVELLAVGYPADKPKESPRNPIEKIACFNTWQFVD